MCQVVCIDRKNERRELLQVAPPYDPGMRPFARMVDVLDLCCIQKLCEAVCRFKKSVVAAYAEPKQMNLPVALIGIGRKGCKISREIPASPRH